MSECKDCKKPSGGGTVCRDCQIKRDPDDYCKAHKVSIKQTQHCDIADDWIKVLAGCRECETEHYKKIGRELYTTDTGIYCEHKNWPGSCWRCARVYPDQRKYHYGWEKRLKEEKAELLEDLEAGKDTQPQPPKESPGLTPSNNIDEREIITDFCVKILTKLINNPRSQ